MARVVPLCLLPDRERKRERESKGRSWKLATFLERKGSRLHGALALNSAVRELSARFSNSVSNSVPSVRPLTQPPTPSLPLSLSHSCLCPSTFVYALVCTCASICMRASRTASRSGARHAYAATTFCIKSFVYGPRRFIGRATMYAPPVCAMAVRSPLSKYDRGRRRRESWPRDRDR